MTRYTGDGPFGVWRFKEIGSIPVVSKHQIQPEYGDEQADAGRDAEPVSRDQILRREWGQGIVRFPCSADHEQDW